METKRLTYTHNKEGIAIPEGAIILNPGSDRIKGYISLDNVIMKHCVRCNTFKVTWEFYWDKSTWDDLDQYCKVCRKELNNARNDRLRNS